MELTIPDQHALRIARKTMRMNCTFALVMGGPDHREAAYQIKRITGKNARIDPDCTCVARQGEGDR